MKSKDVFFVVLVVQLVILAISNLVLILQQLLSGEKLNPISVASLIFFIPISFYTLYDRKSKMHGLTLISTTVAVTFLAALSLGVMCLIPGGITWDILSISLIFIVLLGIGGFLHYFIFGKRRAM